MAGFANPIRAYRFRVEIAGKDQWAIQEVEPPEVGLSVIAHGGGDRDIKTASKKTIGNATLKYLKGLEDKELFGTLWIEQCLKGLPSAYKRNIVVKELANDGITTINTQVWVGCFPVRKQRNTHNRLADENVIEELELSVDEVIEY